MELDLQGRRRGGLRRQGDERHRRDPVDQGVARVKSRLLPFVSALLVIVAACSAPPPRRHRAAHRRTPRHRLRRPPRPPSPTPARRRPHHLRRRVAQGRARSCRTASLRGRQPGHDADDLDRLLVGAGDADRAGRSGRRLPVRRHQEPAGARRQGADRRGRRSPSPATSSPSSCRPTTRRAIKTPADLARPGVKIIAAGDEVPITKYANQLVANLATEPGYPADFAAAYQAEHRVQGGQRQGRRRQARAGRGRCGDRLRHGCEGLDEGRRPWTFPMRRT